jgi:hypothetical protein
MAKGGRGNTVPIEQVDRAIYLYCKRRADGQFLYSPYEIAEALDLDPKTVRFVVRTVLADLFEYIYGET